MSKNNVKEKDEDDGVDLTDEEIDRMEAEKADRAEEIATAVAEAVSNANKDIEDKIAKAVAEALKGVNTAPGASTPAPAPVGTGIFDPNPLKAKMAREKSKKKTVVALAMGYYGVRLYAEGETFEVPVDEKGEWFEDFKGDTTKPVEEELV